MILQHRRGPAKAIRKVSLNAAAALFFQREIGLEW